MKSRGALVVLLLTLGATLGLAQKKGVEPKKFESPFAGAPESARARQNPYEGQAEAARAGHKLFRRYCAECHGEDGRGGRKAPALDSEIVQQSAPGDLFWFITNGNLWAGMPPWSRLPEAQRWQIITFLKSLPPPQAN